MPIYEFICKNCKQEFEALVYGNEKEQCPKCRGKKLEPRLSLFAVSAKGSSTNTSSPEACGTCGDPRGAGACSMPDFD